MSEKQVTRADGKKGPALPSIDGVQKDTEGLVAKWQKGIARYYNPNKNTAGIHFPDVPLDDIAQARWDALSKQVQADVDASGIYSKTPLGEDEEWGQTSKQIYILAARGIEPHTSVVPSPGVAYPSAEVNNVPQSENPPPSPKREDDYVSLPQGQATVSQEARGRQNPEAADATAKEAAKAPVAPRPATATNLEKK